MRTDSVFTLLVLLPKTVALALLIVATMLFTSIHDAYQTHKIEAPLVPWDAVGRKAGPQSSALNESSVTENLHPVLANRHDDVETFTEETTTHRVRSTWKPKPTTTTRSPVRGYGYGGYYGRSVIEEREHADDDLDEIDVRLGRSERHTHTQWNSGHSSEIVRRPPVYNSNHDEPSRSRSTAVDDSAIHFNEDAEDDSHQSSQEKYSITGPPCDMSVVRMFWGISIAVMVIAIMQLLGTALCFSVITSNARSLAGIWMVATMVMTVAFAILAYLSMYYFHNDACHEVPDFDLKWLILSILLVLDPAMLIVLITYTYYIFKIKSDKLLDRHETDSQRNKRGLSKTSSLLNYIYGPHKSYDR